MATIAFYRGAVRIISAASLAAFVLSPTTAMAQSAGGGSPSQKGKKAAVQDSFALSAQLPVDPAVRIGTLPNGLRYYIRQNSKPEKRAELRLVVNAGSILEDEDQRGLAHFTEHMAFNGTTHFAKNEVVKYLESIGVRFGADLNASTSFDETIYILPVPTDSAGVLERSMQFLRDVAGGIKFDSLDVVAERGVVLSEWRDGLGVGERMRDKQIPVIFRGSRYADRLPIGKPEIIEHANPGPLKRFWHDWYRPDLMAVVAVGDAKPDELERLIRTTFGDLPKPAKARQRFTASVPIHDSTLVSIVTDKELTTSNVGILWKRPAHAVKTVGDLRSAIMDELYNNMINQRLAELRLKPESPFVNAGASSGDFVRSASYYSLDATAREGKIMELLRAILTEAERVQRHGFLASELDRARTSILRSYERAFAERDKTLSSVYVSSYIQHYLTGEEIAGIAFEYSAMQKLLPQVTLSDMNALAQERGGAANRTVLISLPDKEGLEVPTEAQVRSVFGTLVATELSPWVDNTSDAALVPEKPTAGRVVSERKIDVLDATEWTLSNGVRVFVKTTDFNADQIVMTAWKPGGASLVDDSLVFSTSLAPAIVEQGGAGTFSLPELGKKVTGKVANARGNITDLSSGLTGGASPRDLETMLELVWLRMTNPRADSSAFKAVLQAIHAQIDNKDASPASVFSDTIQVTLASHHPRVRPISAEMVDALNLSKMLAEYRRFVGNAAGYTFVFVGNVDPAVLKPLAEQWLAALPTTGEPYAPRDVGPKQFTGHVEKIVKKGLAPQSQSIVVLAGAAQWSPDEVYQLTSLGQLLEMRLLDRLREELGGTYSVSANTSFARRMRQEWQVAIVYTSAPEKADMMFSAVEQQLDSLRRVPPTAEEVERIREQQRRELEVAKKQNGYWVNIIRTRAEFGDPLDAPLLAEDRINKLSADQLFRAAQKYLSETNRARFVLLPESK